MSFGKKRKRRDEAEIDFYKPEVKRRKCDNNLKIISPIKSDQIISNKQLKEKYDEYLERTGVSKTIWFVNKYETLSLQTFQDLIKAIRQSSLDQERFPTSNIDQIINTFHYIGKKLKYYCSRKKKEKNFKIENSVFKGCYTTKKNNQEIYYRPTTMQAVQLFVKHFLNESNKTKSGKKIKMKEIEPFLKGLKLDSNRIVISEFALFLQDLKQEVKNISGNQKSKEIAIKLLDIFIYTRRKDLGDTKRKDLGDEVFRMRKYFYDAFRDKCVKILGKGSRYKDISGNAYIRQSWEKLTTSVKWRSHFLYFIIEDKERKPVRSNYYSFLKTNGSNRDKKILNKNRRQNGYLSKIEEISSKKVSKMTKKQNKKRENKPKKIMSKFKHFLQDLKQKISSISSDQKDQDAAIELLDKFICVTRKSLSKTMVKLRKYFYDAFRVKCVRILEKKSRYRDIQGKVCIRQAWEKLATSDKWGSHFKEKNHRKKKNTSDTSEITKKNTMVPKSNDTSEMTKKNTMVQKSDMQIIEKLELNNYTFFGVKKIYNNNSIEISNDIDDGDDFLTAFNQNTEIGNLHLDGLYSENKLLDSDFNNNLNKFFNESSIFNDLDNFFS